MARQKDKIIADVFAVAGLEDPIALCLSGRITIVVPQNDPFEHWFLEYGKPEQRRIISFERSPEIKMVADGPVYKMVYEARYY